MAEQNHAEEACPHTEAPNPPPHSARSDPEKLNEQSSSQPVPEQREPKKPEMVVTDEDYEYTAAPGMSQTEFEQELSALTAEFWYLDPNEGAEEQPKPQVRAKIKSGISKMRWWRDGGKEREPTRKRSGGIEEGGGGLRGGGGQEGAELLFDCESTESD